MKVRSARFGEVDVGDDAVIHFPAGIAPFGRGLDFVLVAAAEGDGRRLGSLRHGTEKADGNGRRGTGRGCSASNRPTTVNGGKSEGQELAWMQSLQLPELGFWVGHAGKLFPERDIGVEAHHLQSVYVEHAEQLCIVLILTIEKEQVTANLLAPVLVNMEAGIGRQIVVAGSIEEVRVPVPACRVIAQAV